MKLNNIVRLNQTFKPFFDFQLSSSKHSLHRNEMTEHEEFVGNLRTITNLLTWNLSLLGEHLKKVGLFTMSQSILFCFTEPLFLLQKTGSVNLFYA